MRRLIPLALVIALAACSDDGPASDSTIETAPASTTTAATQPSTTTRAPEPTAASDSTISSDTSPTTEAAFPYDLTGIWQGVLNHVSSSGPCPATPPQAGTVLIEQIGSTFTLMFDEGFTCNPAGACEFAGTVEGSEYVGSNTGVADSEGGIYTSAIALYPDDTDHVTGQGASTYLHPEMECNWETSLALSR